MACCKKFIILFLILFILFFNFSSVFASEWEDITLSDVYNIHATDNGNVFVSGGRVNYFQTEIGYIYKIEVLHDFSNDKIVVGSSSTPALNGTYDILYTGLRSLGDTYTYSGNDNIFISISQGLNPEFLDYIKVSRTRITGQGTAVDDLVDNVGFNSLWGIFGNTTSYILIVVSVALGLFLLVCVIRGISKTKTKF